METVEANRKKDQDKLLATMEADWEERRVGQERLWEKIETEKEEIKADIKAWREKIAAEMEVIKARMRAIRENMGTSHKEMVAVIEPRRNMPMNSNGRFAPCDLRQFF
jgi:peptidoglycan hydrolase CwlO-like protein